MKFNGLPDNCPPDDVVEANGEVFRLIAGKNPTKEDFESTSHRSPKRSFGDNCIASGLSVYRNKADILQTLNRVPALRKHNHGIAKGILTPKLGVILDTPNNGDSHLTWWLAAEQSPWQVFVFDQAICS